MTKKNTSLILRDSAKIIDTSLLLNAPIEELTDEDSIVAWSMLDVFEKEVFKSRKGALRDRLFAVAETQGEKNKNGSYKFQDEDTGATVTKEHRSGKTVVHVDKVWEMFKENDAIASQIFRYALMLTPNELEMLELIIQHGQLPADMAEAEEFEEMREDLLTTVQDVDSTPELDEGAFLALVKTKAIKMKHFKQVTSVGKPSWALKVVKPTAVLELLEWSKDDGRGDA